MTEQVRSNRSVRAGIVAGVALTVALGAAATIAAQPAPAGVDGATPAAAARGTAGGDSGWTLDGGGGFGVRGHGPIGPITVTSIDGSSLALETADGWTRTITVSGDVTITKGGVEIELGDVKVGDEIRLGQKRNDDGTFTVTAIAVVVPHAAGVVTAIDDTTITIRARGGLERTITTTEATVYRLGQDEASRADIAVGDAIVAAGVAGDNGALTATSIVEVLPRVAGEVTAKGDGSLTLERRDGTTLTVRIDAATTIAVRGVEDATLDDIDVGMAAIVVGTQNDDGSIDAQAIRAGELGLERGDVGPRHGGPRGGAGPGGFGGGGFGGPGPFGGGAPGLEDFSPSDEVS
jgi:hypothetical protein